MSEIITIEQGLEKAFETYDVKNKERSFLMDNLYLFKEKHLETAEHIGRVTLKSIQLALFTNLIAPRTMIYGAMLHDIGKLELPIELLTKKFFSKEDIEKIRQHPVLGYQTLNAMQHKFSARVALLHHWFTKGYPEKLPDTEAGIGRQTGFLMEYCARFVSLADCYDAATHRENDYASPGLGKHMNSEKAKEIVFNENKDLTTLIERLIGERIFEF